MTSRWTLPYLAGITAAAIAAAASALYPDAAPYMVTALVLAIAGRLANCFTADGIIRAARIKCLPIYVAAAWAPIDPTFVINNGWRLALLALILAGLRARLGWPDVAAAGLAAWATFVATVSEAPLGAMAAVGYWSACAIFIACRALVVTRDRIFAVAVCYLGGCAWAAVKAIQNPVDASTDFRPTIDGVNINYVAYALLTAVALIVALVAIYRPPKRTQIVAAVLIAVLVVAISRADTRAALGALVGGVVYLLVRRLSRGGGLAVVAVAIPLVLGLVAFGAVDSSHISLLETPFDRQSGDLSGRLAVWPYARQAWAAEPIFGLGPRVFATENPLGIPAHNLLLDLGVEIGGVGVAAFALVIALALAGYRRSQVRHLAALLLLAWLPLWLTGIWGIAPAAWIVLAVWSRLPEVAGQPEAAVNTSHLESAEFQMART